MRDPQQRARQRAIAPREAIPGSAAPRSQVYAPSSIATAGVVRDVGHFVGGEFVSDTGEGDTTIGDVIRWQRVRYKRGQTPTVGQYTAYGPVETGYPQIPKAGADYTSLKVTGAPTTESAIIRAVWSHGFWNIETLGGGEGSVFPVKLVQSAGAQGTATIAATWTYFIRDIVTNALLQATAVNPTTSPHKWVRPIGQMTKANFGYAHKNTSGVIVLGWINEQIVQEACS